MKRDGDEGGDAESESDCGGTRKTKRRALYSLGLLLLLACLLVIVHVVNIVYIYSIPAQTSPALAELVIT